MELVREFQDLLVQWFIWLKIKVPRAYSTNWYFSQSPLVLLMNREFWKSLDWSYFSGIWMAWLAICIYSVMFQSVAESNKQNLGLDWILFVLDSIPFCNLSLKLYMYIINDDWKCFVLISTPSSSLGCNLDGLESICFSSPKCHQV